MHWAIIITHGNRGSKYAKPAMERESASTVSSSGRESGRSERATANSTREGTAKATVAEQISQAVQSTSNLLHLMQQSSPSQNLTKLPKDLLAKASTIKNTGQILEQLPLVISALDAHMESGLQSVTHLKTIMQLLANMECGWLNSCSHTSLPDPELPNQPPETVK